MPRLAEPHKVTLSLGQDIVLVPLGTTSKIGGSYSLNLCFNQVHHCAPLGVTGVACNCVLFP
jgi:hypothetical protein